jgi:hypothetical protein
VALDSGRAAVEKEHIDATQSCSLAIDLGAICPDTVQHNQWREGTNVAANGGIISQVQKLELRHGREQCHVASYADADSRFRNDKKQVGHMSILALSHA